MNRKVFLDCQFQRESDLMLTARRGSDPSKVRSAHEDQDPSPRTNSLKAAEEAVAMRKLRENQGRSEILWLQVASGWRMTLELRDTSRFDTSSVKKLGFTAMSAAVKAPAWQKTHPCTSTLTR